MIVKTLPNRPSTLVPIFKKEVSVYPKSLVEKITISTQEALEVIDLQEILYFKSESNYTHIQLHSGKVHLISKTLKTFELKLSKIFLRVHKSYLVNRNHIKSFSFKDNILRISGNMEIPVSRRKKDEVIIFLKSFGI